MSQNPIGSFQYKKTLNIRGWKFSEKFIERNLEGSVAGLPILLQYILITFALGIASIAGFFTGMLGYILSINLVVPSHYEYSSAELIIPTAMKSGLVVSCAAIAVTVWMLGTLHYGLFKGFKLAVFTTLLLLTLSAIVRWLDATYIFVTVFITLFCILITACSIFSAYSSLYLIYILSETNVKTFKGIWIFVLLITSMASAYLLFILGIFDNPQTRFLKREETLPSLVTNYVVLGSILCGCSVVVFSILATRYGNKSRDNFSLLKSWAIAVGSWGGTSFYNLDLSNIDFTGAKLANTDFRALKLYRTCLRDVTGLERARVDNRYLDLDNPKAQKLLTKGCSEDNKFSKINLQGAYLRDAYLREFNLTQTNLSGADLQNAILRESLLIKANLTEANLQNANLRESLLIDADLSGAELQGADLRDSVLVRTQVIGVNFTGAKLTGACIEDWSVSSQTCFTNVECDYIYRKLDEQGKSTDRYPLERNFEPGEFESLYEEVDHVIELVFREGLNWRAFSFAFYELQTEEGELELELKGVEQRKDLWVVKVTYNENIIRQLVEERVCVIYEKYAEKERLFAAREEDFRRLLSTTEKQASALLAHAETIQEYTKRPFGNSFVILGSTITNLAGSGKIEYNEASNSIRSLVANGDDRAQVTSLVQSLTTQFQEKGIATTDEQAELIQQIILAVAGENPEFKQLFVQQGQQIADAVPEGAIATAIRNALIQLSFCKLNP
jgi:uncharacterized protein YjbI with pentapeptide repeats